ncbi:putative sphingolipid transporter spinster-like protein 2 [Nymphaea thermarum]|nr:putative sphingolipid transporter spinster-like protein 2 [Nymphaea thermarum]
MADSSNPSWFTPKRLLAIFCVINMLNYVDRGAIASNGVNGTRRTCTDGICTKGTGIQGAFNLNYFEDGVLSSAFMVGLLVASPIFASLAKTLVGVGEASFISLAAPFIDDNAPPSQVGGSTNWRVAFWVEACLMLPFAILGFVIRPLQLKGFFPSSKSSIMPSIQEALVDSKDEVKVDGDASTANDDRSKKKSSLSNSASKVMMQVSRFWGDLKVLLADKVYVVNVLVVNLSRHPGAAWGRQAAPRCYAATAEDQRPPTATATVELAAGDGGTAGGGGGSATGDGVDQGDGGNPTGSSPPGGAENKNGEITMKNTNRSHTAALIPWYISYNFVIGAYSYWGPKAGYAIYNMSNADLLFGGITIVCGIFGTLAGGYILDHINSTIHNAFKLLSGATLFGAVFCFCSFLSPKLYGFVILFSIGELLVFATQAPVNYVCLHCVKPSLRPLSMAMSTVSIHIFGDVPSSPLVGVLQDYVNNWRETALILTSILFIAAAIWFGGIFLHSVDRFNEDDDPKEVSTLESSNRTPLLDVGIVA